MKGIWYRSLTSLTGRVLSRKMLTRFAPHPKGGMLMSILRGEIVRNAAFLETENLVKIYSKSDASHSIILNNVNLTVSEDEYISVISHSGCGKSTLLKIVTDLNKRLDSKEIFKPGSERLTAFTQCFLLPWLKVRENLRVTMDEVLKNTTLDERISIVNKHLAMLNLTVGADKYAYEISRGMKQQVDIARALVIRLKMLQMNKPFRKLDALTRSKLQRQVLDIWENKRQAVMMITHNVDEAINKSDRFVLVINRPTATIGEIFEVSFPHPRDQPAM